MKLKDRSQYPLQLVVPEYNLKLHMDLAPNADIFDLYVGKLAFNLLPYLYDNEEKDDEKREFFAVIVLDGIIFATPNPWSNTEFVNSLDDQLSRR